jgi:hypothetical protein
MPATIRICDVEPALDLFIEKPTQDWFDTGNSNPFATMETNATTLISKGGQAFLDALTLAFNYHYPVSLSPDHIWFLICRGFAKHLSVNAEELRSLLAPHQDKKKIEVVTSSLKTTDFWKQTVDLLTDRVRGEVGEELYALFTPRFSTTTDIDKTVFLGGLLDSTQAYFEYHTSLCGIPSVTLEGTKDDWQNLRNVIEWLRPYKLDWWVNALAPILDHFVAAFDGEVHNEFWANMYHYESESGYEGIDGWIALFFPYFEGFSYELPGHTEKEAIELLKDRNPANEHLVRQITRHKVWRRNPYTHRPLNGKMRLPMNSLIMGLGIVPMKMHNTMLSFSAGFIGVSQDGASLALRPELGWYVDNEENCEQYRRHESALTPEMYAKEQEAKRQTQEWQKVKNTPPVAANTSSKPSLLQRLQKNKG